MLSTEELIREISDKSKKSEEDVKKLIKDKQLELSGLVSGEGAAYIVGRELGVDLIKDTRRQLKIKNLVPDMRSVDLVAKVLNVFEPREFESKGKKGVVTSVILGDETGTTRLPLWNEEVELVSSLGIVENDIIEVSGAWAKEDQRGGVELRMGKRGKLKKLDGGDVADFKDVPSRESPGNSQGPAQRAAINMIRPGMNVVVKGCIVQAYKKRPYYEACPECGSRAEEKDGKFVCKDHKEVEPAYNLLLSGVIDDGSGNVRVVLFREAAGKVFGKSAEEIKEEFTRDGLEPFWENFSGLGKEFMIEGRVKTNDFSKESEIMANTVKDVSVKDECKRLFESLEK